MKTVKKILASLGLFIVSVGLGAFVAAAGGVEWGTEAMGAIMFVAVAAAVIAQPIVWADWS